MPVAVRLTAALITRDEEAHIGGCLESLAGLVDEVVVVDTGSVDKTPEIAASVGARVVKALWQDDFASVRNIGLTEARGQWILYVDADERVSPTGDLYAALAVPDAIAARVQFRASSRLTPYREYRLFRNHPEIRFRGVIHETIMPDVRRLAASGGGRIVDAPLAFEHLGYEGDLEPKHRRNLPLLRRAVEQDPERIYLWHALGEAELGLGDPVAAESAWRRGLAVIRSRNAEPGDVMVYADLLDLHLSGIGQQLPDIAELVNEANCHHYDDPLILWWTSRFLAGEGDHAAAKQRLNRLLAYGPEGPSKRGAFGYDHKLFGAYAWAMLGVCCLAEGKPVHALEWLRRAEAADRSNAEIRVKRAYAEALCRTHAARTDNNVETTEGRRLDASAIT
jgi:tetratricopeptide (TPR) repeat protein